MAVVLETQLLHMLQLTAAAAQHSAHVLNELEVHADRSSSSSSSRLQCVQRHSSSSTVISSYTTAATAAVQLQLELAVHLQLQLHSSGVVANVRAALQLNAVTGAVGLAAVPSTTPAVVSTHELLILLLAAVSRYSELASLTTYRQHCEG
jgi:hypothetical protein